MIKIFKDQEEVQLKTWKFPVGETGIKIEDPISTGLDGHPSSIVYIVKVSFESNDDIINCLQVVDALQSAGVPAWAIIVDFAYLPYSRQDRVCHPGESFALKVLLDVLGTMKVLVRTVDLHSPVAFTQLHTEFLMEVPQYVAAAKLPKFDYIVAPDKGASTKIGLHLQVGSGTKVAVCNKQRIGSKIVYMDLEYDTVQGSVCVVDDLADGGGTFLALADMLKRTQPGITDLNLYVTHGFFTAGIDKLAEKYDNVYSSNLQSKDPAVLNFVKEI